MDKIRAAVIGCGHISVMHLDTIIALDEAELVSVCDIYENDDQKDSWHAG